MHLTQVLILWIMALLLSSAAASSSLLDNTCTFRVDGRLFALSYLNRNAYTPRYYSYILNGTTKVVFNFC